MVAIKFLSGSRGKLENNNTIYSYKYLCNSSREGIIKTMNQNSIESRRRLTLKGLCKYKTNMFDAIRVALIKMGKVNELQ